LARQKNLSQEQIKIRILSYLYNKEEGANQHNIQFHAILGRHTQEATRFKRLLEELCKLERIQEVDMSHVAKGRVIYKITDKGRKTIESLRNNYLIKEVLGLAEEEI
jgi:predicted transcriptional regulator